MHGAHCEFEFYSYSHTCFCHQNITTIIIAIRTNNLLELFCRLEQIVYIVYEI